MKSTLHHLNSFHYFNLLTTTCHFFKTLTQKKGMFFPRFWWYVTTLWPTEKSPKKAFNFASWRIRRHLHSWSSDVLEKNHAHWKIASLVGGFNPVEKYYIVNLDHFPILGGQNEKYLKPPLRSKRLKPLITFGDPEFGTNKKSRVCGKRRFFRMQETLLVGDEAFWYIFQDFPHWNLFRKIMAHGYAKQN